MLVFNRHGTPGEWLMGLIALLNMCLPACSQHNAAAAANGTASKDAFISNLISQMTIPDMVLQLYLLFADDVVGPNSNNELYSSALSPAPGSPIGVIHDWYPLNKTYFNELQRLNQEKSHLKIPFMHTGECLHGVGSFKQSMFPQSLSMAASWDVDLVRHVGSAIGAEARSIGIHACFSPVLDICQDPRWGRCQEDWGEDYILTSHMGVAYAAGMSKNRQWSRNDAVVPVMKHFAAHGAPQSGLNAAPFMGHGMREVLMKLLTPFKAVFELGGARGVMMAYSELDDVPSHVNPLLYDALDEWGYDGFVIADDTGMAELENTHAVASGPADAIMQWFNAGGMISFYDYPLDVYLNATEELVRNGSVKRTTLEKKVRQILGVKWDLGLFDDPYIPEEMDPYALVEEHVPLTLEAARKSIVLLENKDSILPLDTQASDIGKLALIGPFSDILNYGDYSGTFGAYPVAHSTTIREGMLNGLKAANSSIELVSSAGANTWLYNAQYPVPGYHLSANGKSGGLQATYFADTNFSEPLVHTFETPVRDWGLYPPPGLPSNNFSAVWEGTLTVPVDVSTDGWLGVAITYNATANLYIDGKLHAHIPFSPESNILSNIPGLAYTNANATAPPPGAEPFTFTPGATHRICLEFQSYNLYQKIANQNSLNAQVLLFWNLVDRSSPIEKAVSLAQEADAVVLAVGARWDSDGESGDRSTLDLSGAQMDLTNAVLDTGKPAILVLEGGRPFAIPEIYNRSAAVLSTGFGGQSAGRAVADVIFGNFNPGGRLPVSVPKSVGQLPKYYNYKPSAERDYVDQDFAPSYPFGYGLSYTNFTTSVFGIRVGGASGGHDPDNKTFTAGDILVFSVTVSNTGPMAGSYVPQVYLLGRVSSITQPVKQLVAFARVYLDAGEKTTVQMEVEVDRYLRILDRSYEWQVERGEYTFALLESGGLFEETSRNVTARIRANIRSISRDKTRPRSEFGQLQRDAKSQELPPDDRWSPIAFETALSLVVNPVEVFHLDFTTRDLRRAVVDLRPIDSERPGRWPVDRVERVV